MSDYDYLGGEGHTGHLPETIDSSSAATAITPPATPALRPSAKAFADVAVTPAPYKTEKLGAEGYVYLPPGFHP